MPNKISIATLDKLLLLKIMALYDVETQLIKALPKMAGNSDDEDLKSAFEEHLEQTRGHAEKLEKIFEILEEKPKKTKVDAIRGLVKDAEWVIKNIKDKKTRDASLIATGQYVEHYEMAGYGTALEWAKLLELETAADLLEIILNEEKEADEKLNELAKTKINLRAMVVDGE